MIIVTMIIVTISTMTIVTMTIVTMISTIMIVTNLSKRPCELGKCATEWGVVPAMETYV